MSAGTQFRDPHAAPCKSLPANSGEFGTNEMTEQNTFTASERDAEFVKIEDFHAPGPGLYRLTETQLLRLYEPERGVFIAESPKVIERALQAGCVPISVLCEERYAKEAAWLIGRYRKLWEAEGQSFAERKILIYTCLLYTSGGTVRDRLLRLPYP